LKNEIHFMHIQSYDDLKFTQIVNILFHEIANEWISFATEVLYYPKREAISELQDKVRVKFIHAIAKGYYEKYKRQIFEEIADTFIELVSKVKQDKEVSKLIQETLQSDLIKNRQILEMHNFSQLYNRVIDAQNIKNSDITAAKMKVIEIKKKYTSPAIDTDEKQRLHSLLNKAEKELSKLKHQGLDKFDPGIKRLKDTMVQSMISINNLESYK
ncbi:MAG: hypothetical protein PF437_03760, partial [Sulfurimonas sp.]|nr:hypothetical protein [Sulfurimonas sp.]